MTQYDFYFGKTRLPVTPGKLDISIKDKNETVVLASEGEVSIPKKPGLTTYEFKFLLPTNPYPFARYMNGNGFENPETYLTKLEKYKKKKKHFEFSVSFRNSEGVKPVLSQVVEILDYKIVHDAEDNNDVTVQIKLRQYRSYKTQVVKVKKAKKTGKATAKKPKTNNRPSGVNQPKTNTTYTVVANDTLYGIAKKYYGDGERYVDIFNANKDKVRNPSLIYPGQVLVIP